MKAENQIQMLRMQNELINPTTAWLMFLFLGWSYGSMGQMGKQILYYLTLGGLGLWTIYRLFTLNSAIRKYNDSVFEKYHI